MKFPNSVFPINVVLITFLVVALLAISVFLGLAVGSSTVNISEVIMLFLKSDTVSPVSASIIWKIRLPRVLMSGLAGAALSLGGLVLQVLLRNPLAEPYILGISGGSAIGAILGILAGFPRFPGVAIMAFSGSMVTIILLIWLASACFIFNKDSLLLAGVMVNAFCSAIIMFLVSMTHDSRLNNIMFWLMGDFSMVSLDGMGLLIIVIIICFFILFACSNWMNLLQLGDDMAQSMGIHVKRVSAVLLFCASFMVSISVSYCGLIGFVGLVIPHTLRLILSTDHRVLVPACVVCGSTYVILCDVMARVLLSNGEIPTGVITALIGAPVFIYLLVVRSSF